ncbi:hypothetical protein EBT31_13170 [bacterium]|nr:hypothetical protein [bacterium]
MSKAEIQRQFDYAVRQVIKQGRPAYNSRKGCVYRMKRGDTTLKCPVGWLIPDAYFIKYPEHIVNTEAEYLDPSAYSYSRMKPFADNKDLLKDLQQSHDDAAQHQGSPWKFVSLFIFHARTVAYEHGLKWNF